MGLDDLVWARRLAWANRAAGGVTATVAAIANVATLALLLAMLEEGRGPVSAVALVPAAAIAGLATLVAMWAGIRLTVAGALATQALASNAPESAEQAFRRGTRAAAAASVPAVLQVLVVALLFAGGLSPRRITREAVWLVVLLLPIPLIPLNALAATRVAQSGLGDPPPP